MKEDKMKGSQMVSDATDELGWLHLDPLRVAILVKHIKALETYEESSEELFRSLTEECEKVIAILKGGQREG
jgi:hypothetical protein